MGRLETIALHHRKVCFQELTPVIDDAYRWDGIYLRRATISGLIPSTTDPA